MTLLQRFGIRVTALAGIALVAPALAQDGNFPSEEQLKALIAVREKRVELLRDEIKQTDERIESQLDHLIKTLISIRDSKDSQSKVAGMKEATMKRLAMAIEYYDGKRAAFRQELLNPRTVIQDKEKREIVATFDARIEKRTEQIVALKKSMPDVYADAAAAGGKGGPQTREMKAHNDTQQQAILKQLDESIARLERMGVELRAQQAAAFTPAMQKERAADVAKNDVLIAERRELRAEVLNPSDQGEREVTLKEAADLNQLFIQTTDALRRDFTALFQRYDTFITELKALRATEATLATLKVR